MGKQQKSNTQLAPEKKEKAQGSNKPNEFSFKKEVQIGVLAIVASLGFFKVDDLKSFIDVIGQLIVEDLANETQHDISVYLLAGLATFSYLFYFFGFGVALLTMFQRNKNFVKAILVSVASYFLMYLFLVILIFKGPYITKMPGKENRKAIPNAELPTIHYDSLEPPIDTVLSRR